MRIASSIAAAAAAATVLSVLATPPASAQRATRLQNNTVYMFMNGRMVHKRVNAATHARIMQEFRPMASGTMVYYSNGRFYSAEDRPMADGRMMHVDIFGSGFDGRSR